MATDRKRRPRTVELGLLFNKLTFVAIVAVALFFGMFFERLLSMLLGVAPAAFIGIAIPVIAAIWYMIAHPLTKNGIRNIIVNVSEVRRLPASTKATERGMGENYAWHRGLRRFDVTSYVQAKSNAHTLAIGIAGVGKTTLLIHLARLEKARTKICFSYKINDDYLRMGYPVIDIARALPDPFTDLEAFVTAFLISNPITNSGIQASYNSTMLRQMAERATTWKQFFDNVARAEDEARKKRNGNEIASLSWIRQKASQLTGPTHSKAIVDYIIGNPEIVLDFSQVTNETARTFYSELALRQIWAGRNRIDATQGRILIAFDEVHRLVRKQKSEQDFRSILETYLREGRSAGFRVFSGSQNYSDLDPKITNNYATQWVFQTTNQDDLYALSVIEPMLSWAAADLPPNLFMDAKQPNIHSGISVYQLAYPTRLNEPTQYIEIAKEREVPVQKEEAVTISEEEILGLLKEKPRTPTGLAGTLAQKHGVPFEAAKLRVTQVLTRLRQKSGLVDSMRFDLPHSKKFKMLYFLRGENISQLHNFMQEEILVGLREAGNKILDVAKSGEFSKPDIETDKFGVEVETGLKRKFDDLKERIGKSKKQIVVIVPNKDIRDAYSKIFPTALVTCFYDFIESVKSEAAGEKAIVGAGVVRGEEEGEGNG